MSHHSGAPGPNAGVTDPAAAAHAVTVRGLHGRSVTEDEALFAEETAGLAEANTLFPPPPWWRRPHLAGAHGDTFIDSPSAIVIVVSPAAAAHSVVGAKSVNLSFVVPISERSC